MSIQPYSRKAGGWLLGMTLALAVLLPPVGLFAGVAFGIVSRRQGAIQRGTWFFVIAGVAALVVVLAVVLALRTSTGGGGGVVR